VSVDATTARALLAGLGDARLTSDRARAIAALPGSRGLIRKARSYGRPASDTTFAAALLAAAHGDTAAPDPSRFGFGSVRARAAQNVAVLDRLEDPVRGLVGQVRARIARFTPPDLAGAVTGRLVVGGTSGGFAFGEPEFFLNVDRFRSATLAATIMQHELYHAVQALARAARTADATAATRRAACLAAVPHADVLSQLFNSLQDEGTASLVGDVLALPPGVDDVTNAERASVARNVGMVARSVTQLELSVHGLTTGADVSYDDVHALGFYGDEVLYALGYVMARAIAQEQGDAAVAALAGGPGAAFVARYVRLKRYGSDAAPALRAGTIRTAEQVAACG
jgi:hypothetical protein